MHANVMCPGMGAGQTRMQVKDQQRRKGDAMTRRYGLTADEQARLDAVPWPHTLHVAGQIDAERAEAARKAAAAEDKRLYEEGLAWAAWTRNKADQETRSHAAGQPCDQRYCRYEH